MVRNFDPASTYAFKADRPSTLESLAARRLRLYESEHRNRQTHEMFAGRFVFLSESIKLSDQRLDDSDLELDWNPKAARLWKFHLQCQEYLLALSSSYEPRTAWQVIESWINDSRHANPAMDPDAWHPFCISRRLPVWLMLAAIQEPPAELASKFWVSVTLQTRWLRDHLEVDLGGNHLFENLRALMLADCFLTTHGDIDSKSLRRQIGKQIELQVLGTGEHIERTPTYHCIMLLAAYETLEACHANGEGLSQLAAVLREKTASMARFLDAILHPDGQIPLFADSALDETPNPRQLCDELLDDPRQTLATENIQNDYFTHSTPNGDKLIVDFGPLACDHLPAHGHADLFTLEASIDSKRVIVDAGTFDYQDSEMRQYCRGTQGHNTLQVAGHDHADIWSSFRMGHRGHPLRFAAGRCSTATGHAIWKIGTHDAYRRLGITEVTRAAIAFEDQDQTCSWLILDWISKARPSLRLESPMRIHPDWTIQRENETSFWLKTRDEANGIHPGRLSTIGSTEIAVSEGWYCPEFGKRIECQCLSAALKPAETHACVGWLLQNNLATDTVSCSRTDESLLISRVGNDGKIDTLEIDL